MALGGSREIVGVTAHVHDELKRVGHGGLPWDNMDEAGPVMLWNVRGNQELRLGMPLAVLPYPNRGGVPSANEQPAPWRKHTTSTCWHLHKVSKSPAASCWHLTRSLVHKAADSVSQALAATARTARKRMSFILLFVNLINKVGFIS